MKRDRPNKTRCRAGYLWIASTLLLVSINSCRQQAEKLFSQLPSSSTGITFKNLNVDADTLNILDYLYYYNGGGVAVGDINNDGLPDIYFTSNTGSNRLYLNKGNFKFEDITEKAGVAASTGWKTGVVMADVNGDGLLDIYVCEVGNHRPSTGNGHTYFAGARNQLFINKGNLKFEEQAKQWGLDVAGYNTQAVFFDYDLDGDLDMFLLQHSIHQTANYGDTAVRNVYSGVSGGKLFRNDGDHFTDVTRASGIISSSLGYGLGVSVADLNHDGYDDIYVGNDFHENDYYYINQRNGTFKEINRQAFGHESKFSMGNDIADLNNDGWPDIITLDMLPEDEKVLKSSVGDESFSNYALRTNLGYYNQYARNCVQLNVGRGMRFAEIGLYSGVAATDWSWSPLAADFDLDGYNDLFISNGIKRRLNDLDYVKFSSSLNYSGARSPVVDNELLKRQPPGEWHNYIFEGDSSLRFIDKSQQWGFDVATLSQGAAYADLDNDGAPDIITNNMNDEAGIYKNNARTSFKDNHYLSLNLRFKGRNPFALGSKVFVYAGGSIFYRELQAVHGFMSSSEPVLHFGLAGNSFVDSILVIWPDKSFLKIKKTPADQQLNIKWQPGHNDHIDQYEAFVEAALHQVSTPVFVDVSSQTKINFRHGEDVQFNDFNQQPFLPHQLSTQGPKIAVGDVNGDGQDDFFVCGARGQPGRLYVQQKDGTFVSTNESLFGQDAESEKVNAVFFDADGDKDLDLYVVTGGNEFMGNTSTLRDKLYLNDGHGNFSLSTGLPDFYGDKSVVCAADIDGDGDIDLFVGGRDVPQAYGQTPPSYILINDGKGNFTIKTDVVAPGLKDIGMITDACWVDVNNDHKPDLVVAGEWMPVTVFINQNGKLQKTSTSLDAYTGWWNCLYATDINGDGYTDFIAGNLGLNSKMHASAKYPLKLYIGDFDQNGISEQLMAIEKNGQYYPFLGKEDLEKNLPFLKKAFLGYSSMAGKTMEEIFGNRLRNSSQLSITTLQSVALINDQKGGFYLRDLPVPMQWAPIFSACSKDFSGDRKADLIVGGNFYGVNPFEGRYDAMALVVGYGDGKGNYQPQLPLDKSLMASGQVRDIKPIRINGANALLVAFNNDSLRVLRY